MNQGWFIMSLRLLTLSFLLLLQVGCADFHVGRSYLSEMEHDDSSFFNPRNDFPVVAGDTGRDWLSDSERRKRTPASEGEQAEDRISRSLKSELRTLEGMESEESLEFYQSHLKSLPTVSDRIYFLKLPRHERSSYLATRGVIQETVHPLSALDRPASGKKNDVYLGMRKNDVLASLGKPMRVDIAGNPRYENERWLYRLNGSSKYIYFESGKVGGWE